MGKIQKTKIEFEYEGVDYTLEYTAASLKKMEEGGFDFAHLDRKVLTAAEELFYGAFLANHKNTPRKVCETIYKEFSESAEDGGASLTDVLGQMLNEALEELTSHKGNIKWKVAK